MKNINVLKLGLIALLQISSMPLFSMAIGVAMTAKKVSVPSLPVKTMSISNYGKVAGSDLSALNNAFNSEGLVSINFSIYNPNDGSGCKLMAISYYGENRTEGRVLHLPLSNNASSAAITMNGVNVGTVNLYTELLVTR